MPVLGPFHHLDQNSQTAHGPDDEGVVLAATAEPDHRSVVLRATAEPDRLQVVLLATAGPIAFL